MLCLSSNKNFVNSQHRKVEFQSNTDIFTFTDCITTISYLNSNSGMNWMRIRTSWIDFEFGLSEKRTAAVNDDIELRRTYTYVYYSRGPNTETEREMLPPWSYLIWDQRKTRRELRWKRFNSNSNCSCFLFLFSFLLFSFSSPLILLFWRFEQIGFNRIMTTKYHHSKS